MSDLHLGKNLHGIELIDDQEFFLKKIVEMVIQQKIDTVLIAGDIYDTSSQKEIAIKIFDEFLVNLSKEKINVLLISGNHDSAERLNFGSRLLDQANVFLRTKILPDGKLPCVDLQDEFGTIHFYFLPSYRDNALKLLCPPFDENNREWNEREQNLRFILDQTNINPNERNILLAHESIFIKNFSQETTGTVTNISVKTFQDYGFDYVALGHIHKSQKILENVVYAGSILKYSLSEVDYEKKLPVVTLKNKNELQIDWQTIQPKHELRKIEGLLHDLLKEPKSDDYIYAVVTDDHLITSAKNELHDLFPKILRADQPKVPLPDILKNRSNITITRDMSFETIIEKYWAYCFESSDKKDAKPTEDEMKVLLSIAKDVGL